jgi:hypothetical protein
MAKSKRQQSLYPDGHALTYDNLKRLSSTKNVHRENATRLLTLADSHAIVRNAIHSGQYRISGNRIIRER